jgi:hypothetical protein
MVRLTLAPGTGVQVVPSAEVYAVKVEPALETWNQTGVWPLARTCEELPP